MNERSELHEGLARLADLAADDGAGRRMTDRVAPMVARVRRRRAARRTGTGLAAASTAAVLALAGYAVGGHQPALPPASGEASPPAHGTARVVECGAVAPALPTPGDGPMAVAAFLGGSLSSPMLTQTIANDSGDWVTSTGPVALQVLVMSGDRVVAVATYSQGGSGATTTQIEPTWHTSWSTQLPDGTDRTFTTCYPGTPGGALPDGRYEMRAVYADATQVLGSGGAWEATVSDGSIHSATASAASDALNAQTAAARALARQQIQEYALEATATSGTATFPECGSPVPQTNQPLTLTLKRPAMPSEAGEGAQSGLVTLRTTAGRSVVADVPRSGALLRLHARRRGRRPWPDGARGGCHAPSARSRDRGNDRRVRQQAELQPEPDRGRPRPAPRRLMKIYAVLDADVVAVTEFDGTTSPGGHVQVVGDLGGAEIG